MNRVTESTRTILYALCLVGMWIFPLWLFGGITVVRRLGNAPASWHKRGMRALLFVVPVWLSLYVTIMTIYAATSKADRRSWAFVLYENDLRRISAIMLIAYGALCGLFVACADMTFRSTRGAVSRDLADPVYLRGVSLGCGLGALFTFNPLVSTVSAPIVLWQLWRKRHAVAGFPAIGAVGIAACLTGCCTLTALIVCASISRDRYGEHCYGGCRGSIPYHDPLWLDLWRPYNDSGLAPVLLIVSSLLHAAFEIVFVALADAMILRLIGDALLAHPCLNCKSLLQFALDDSGSAQVQCSMCQSVVEFIERE